MNDFQSVNTKHDAASYESNINSSYTREIHDPNSLYDGFLQAKRGSDWKTPVQRFEMDFLSGIAMLSDDLRSRSYQFKPSKDFILNERGKTRVIRGEQIEDRIVKHSLCDEVLNPNVANYLIFDNGASQLGKGISFTRRRLDYHLHKFYRTYHDNEGYVLLVDFSKYYDNIQHQILLDLFKKYVSNSDAIWLVEKVLDSAKVDVSYMDHAEYFDCLSILFNSVEYSKIPRYLLTGQKFMHKHLNIGDQVAQTSGIAYRIPIDNYIKIVRGVKFYDVYMDDSIVMHRDKHFLEGLAEDIEHRCRLLGITMNTKKSYITKLSSKWRFLQVQYSLTETGRVIKKIHPKRLTSMRQRMKRRAPYMYMKEFSDWYQSWFQAYYKLMSKRQRTNMDTLFNTLKEETLCTQ